jgi:hypothetical protein
MLLQRLITGTSESANIYITPTTNPLSNLTAVGKRQRCTLYAVLILNVNHIRFEIITWNAMKAISGILICAVLQLYGRALNCNSIWN